MSRRRLVLVGIALALAALLAAWAFPPAPAAAQTPPPRGPFELTSQLGRKLYAQPEDAAIRAARQALAAHPGDPRLVLALSLALANRRQYREAVAADTRGLAAHPRDAALLLERGHRELGLRRFAAAQRDLERSVALDPKQLQAHYHLALSHYFQGQFAAAAAAFRDARDLAANNDDLIDCTNWLYVSLQRAHQPQAAAQALQRIGPAVTNTEPHIAFYLRLVRFYQGRIPQSDVLPPARPAPDTDAELSYETVAYGIGNWHLYHGDPAAARALFRQVVGGQAWNAWGFIGAETDLTRLPH